MSPDVQNQVLPNGFHLTQDSSQESKDLLQPVKEGSSMKMMEDDQIETIASQFKQYKVPANNLELVGRQLLSGHDFHFDNSNQMLETSLLSQNSNLHLAGKSSEVQETRRDKPLNSARSNTSSQA